MILSRPTLRLATRHILRSHQKRNFSFEPVAVVDVLTSSLQQIHAVSGVPWWALIPLTTFGLRGIWTFPLAVLQRLRIQKQTALRPVISATAPILRYNLAKKALAANQRASQIATTTAESTGKASSSASSSSSTTATTASSGTASLATVATALSPLKQMRYEEIMVLSAKEVRRRQKRLFRDNGVQLYKNLFLPMAQVPLWVCMSLTFRNLSGWSKWDSLSSTVLDPALYSEGALWFTDLTVLDSFHMFPLALGAIALVNAEWTFKTLDLMKEYTPKKVLRMTFTDSLANVSRMMVVFLMAISWHAPTALTLYWLSSQVFSLVQNVFLDLVFPTSFTPNKRLDYKKLSSAVAQDVIVHRK